MFREKVIITKLPVMQAGQIHHFQVKIPRDAERIIGMEVSAQYLDMQLLQTAAALKAANLPAVNYARASQYTYLSLEKRALGSVTRITPDLFLGDVRLQSCEDTNIFYAEDIYFTDENLAFGDFSARNRRFFPTSPTHGYKHEECVVNTCGKTTILKGIYRDRQNPQSAINSPVFFQYTASIYVWYETKIQQA